MTPSDCLDLYEDAEFYDFEFSARDHELPFYRAWARKAGGPVLEIACGTGRLTLRLAQDGHDITGLDLSRHMLDRARAKAAAAGLGIEWLEQDCRDMRLTRQFGFAFAATNAMQHLLDVESACAFLRSARAALRDDGVLVLDVFNPSIAKLTRTADERYLFKALPLPDGSNIRVEAASRYDAATQVLHFDLFYLRGGELVLTKSVNMRCFFPEELRALCTLNGLEVCHRFGDYDERPFDSASPKQILICRPASHQTAPAKWVAEKLRLEYQEATKS
jgi:SAM-dependent methyltransferase